MPDSGMPTTIDPNKLLASQNEATRIIRKLDRLEAKGKGPFKPDRTEVLKAEYQRGLETGGMQGGAICRVVLAIADELGIDTNDIVDGFRKPRHCESLERAQHAARLSQLIGKQVSEPPFLRPGRRGRGSDDSRPLYSPGRGADGEREKRCGQARGFLHLRHLERYPLRTS